MIDDLDYLLGELQIHDRTVAESPDDLVPVLIARLEDLLAATARYRQRGTAVGAEWDAWHEEGDRLRDEYGFGVDIEHYRTIRAESLPELPKRDARDDLKQRIIEALNEIGDQRAAPVIVAALADPACVAAAAQALRDVRADHAVPALLDAVTLLTPEHSAFNFGLLDTLQDYGVSRTQVRERFEAETSPQGRMSLMHLLTKLPDDGSGKPDESQLRDSLIFLALDYRGAIDRWSVLSWLDRIDNRTGRMSELIGMEAPPTDVIRAAITLAAHGNPPGYDHELKRRIRHFAHTPSATRAVEAVLTRQAPDPDIPEVRLALELALAMNAVHVNDPMRLTRALYRLSSHPQFGDRARLALRRKCWDLLFSYMVDGDAMLRDEARGIFQSIATTDEHAAFARFTASPPSRWSKLLRRFRRR